MTIRNPWELMANHILKSGSSLLLLAGLWGTGVGAQVPDGLKSHEEARTRMCVIEAVDPPDAAASRSLSDRGAGLAAILETSGFQGVVRGGEALPSEMVSLQQKVERYNRAYADLMADCREAERAGADCAETREMTSLREEIRAEAAALLSEMGEADLDGGAGAWNAWALDCADRLLLRSVVGEVCPEGSAAICGASDDWVEAHGTTLQIADDMEQLWAHQKEEPWSRFEPLVSGGAGVTRGGETKTRVQVGNIIARVRLGLDLVRIDEDPGRAAAAAAFGAAFDMEFVQSGWTVLPVIEFSLEQDRPILGETVYAFFVETESGPATVLNAQVDADQPFAWSTPLRPDVAEWLQSGQPLWFTAGGPIAGGGMGPRFTFQFPAEGLQDAILDMAIYLTGDVLTDLNRIAAGG